VYLGLFLNCGNFPMEDDMVDLIPLEINQLFGSLQCHLIIFQVSFALNVVSVIKAQKLHSQVTQHIINARTHDEEIL
jgi:hypothetical protein